MGKRFCETLPLTDFHENSLQRRERHRGKRKLASECPPHPRHFWFLSFSAHNFKVAFIPISQITTLSLHKSTTLHVVCIFVSQGGSTRTQGLCMGFPSRSNGKLARQLLCIWQQAQCIFNNIFKSSDLIKF